MSRLEKKARLINQLAHFLTDDQAGKSIMLQMEQERSSDDTRPALAKEWAALRGVSQVGGYPTFEEAVEVLNELL